MPELAEIRHSKDSYEDHPGVPAEIKRPLKVSVKSLASGILCAFAFCIVCNLGGTVEKLKSSSHCGCGLFFYIWRKFYYG